MDRITKITRAGHQAIADMERDSQLRSMTCEEINTLFSQMDFDGWAYRKDGELIGYVIYSEAANGATILRLHVAYEHRRHGYGTALLHKVMCPPEDVQNKDVRMYVPERSLDIQCTLRQNGFLYVGQVTNSHGDVMYEFQSHRKGAVARVDKPFEDFAGI